MTTRQDRPAPLAAVLTVTVTASLSGGVFWAGIFFVTAQHYQFSPARNLVLATVMGAIYAVAAAAAGKLVRRLSAWSSPRAVLMSALAAWTSAALVPLTGTRAEGPLWAAALLGAAASAMTWPIVESYLSAGRHGADMRAVIGWFNVTWTPATALALLLAPILSGEKTLLLSAAGSLAALAAARALPARPGAHAPEAAHAAVGPEYGFLMRAASWLLPMAYVLCSAMSPLLPHRLASVSGGNTGGGIAGLWMVARFATLLTMWRTGFWHGRWGTLALGGGALALGLAAILLAPSLVVLAAGLVLFGVGMGLTYYAAIYYSLAVGHAAVDAGGNFEALIGFGYFVGPLLGLSAQAVATPAHATSVTVLLAWVVTAAGAAGAVRPYLAARRARAARSIAPISRMPV